MSYTLISILFLALGCLILVLCVMYVSIFTIFIYCMSCLSKYEIVDFKDVSVHFSVEYIYICEINLFVC